MTTREDIWRHRTQGSWRDLEQKAQALIADARRAGGDSFTPVLGGGTRLMLALDHRISDDIDLFITSAGWLPYVSPRLNDRFEAELLDYAEDSSFVKINLPQGQIDFIAASSLLDDEATSWNPAAKETSLPLMPPAEILAKKLFFRGWALTARDLFDWMILHLYAPTEAIHEAAFARLLKGRTDKIGLALSHMESRENQRRAWENIQSPYRLDFSASIQIAKDCLLAWSSRR